MAIASTSTRFKLPPAGEMEPHTEEAAGLLKSLANPHRLAILCVLGEGELSVGALNRRVPLSQSALSQHLAVLRDECLVDTRRESQTVYYAVRPGPALDILKVLHQHFCAPVSRGSTKKTRQ